MEHENQPYQAPYATPNTAVFPQQLNHSKLGVASFVISLVVGVLLFALFIYAGYVESKTPGGMDEESIDAVLIGLGIIGSFGALFVGFIIGIAGLFQKGCKKVFAILGTIFSGVVFLSVVGLMILGAMVG